MKHRVHSFAYAFAYAYAFVLALLTGHHVSAQDSLYPAELKPGRLATTIAAQTTFYVGGMSYLQFIWYRDHDRVPFHFYNDAAGYLQIDKCGHAFGAYLESYLSYEWLRRSGVPRNKALAFGAPMGFFMQLPIEVFDGIYEGWGFSLSDVAANAAGSALVVAQELALRRQLIKYKFSYSRSMYAQMGNGYLGNGWLESMFYDYNGHTYWLSMPIGLNVGGYASKRILCVAVGYSANGIYGEFTNATRYRGQPLPQVERYRQLVISLDIDWTRLGHRHPKVAFIADHLFWLKLPMPAITIDPVHGLRAHALYF